MDIIYGVISNHSARQPDIYCNITWKDYACQAWIFNEQYFHSLHVVDKPGRHSNLPPSNTSAYHHVRQEVTGN